MNKANRKNKVVSPDKFVSKEPKTINNAFIYCRVNVNATTSGAGSLKQQEQFCEKYCRQNNLNVVKVFSANESGSINRKVFNKMINPLLKGKSNVKYIVVYGYDRFGRTGNISLIKELRKMGIQVCSITQPVDIDNTALLKTKTLWSSK